MLDPFAKRPDDTPTTRRDRFLARYPEQRRKMEENISKQPVFLRPFLLLWFKAQTWRLDMLYKKLLKERDESPDR
ncbi:MAG: hypothetical protein H0T73_08910 [Ardenticatenales bacterium]|nr:hypothetical protein [Ardenticatenales bacterium]